MRGASFAAALLRLYALSLSASGWGSAAAPVLALAQQLDTTPSAAPSDLRAAGLLSERGELTPEGRAVLAEVLDGARPQGEE